MSRIITGIVLEPEVVDAQGDIYSAAEIRQAARRFKGRLMLMHREPFVNQVAIVESCVRRGVWRISVEVFDDELWRLIEAGELTGFSVGGDARPQPEGTARRLVHLRIGEVSLVDKPANRRPFSVCRSEAA